MAVSRYEKFEEVENKGTITFGDDNGGDEGNREETRSSTHVSTQSTEVGLENTTSGELWEINYVEPAHERRNREMDNQIVTALQRSTRQRHTPSWWRGTLALISNAKGNPESLEESIGTVDIPQWKTAMDHVYQSLTENGIRKLVDRSSKYNVVCWKLDL